MSKNQREDIAFFNTLRKGDGGEETNQFFCTYESLN